MKGDAQPLIKFFDGSDKRFIIPLYQRNYDWEEKNCEQLFQDLLKLHTSQRKNHFFGSIVSKIQPGTEDRLIIDGQQRITTVSLLLIALVNARKAKLINATEEKLVEKIFKRYLVDEYQESERKVKLKPIKKDMQAFDALLYGNKDKFVQTSNVTRNYNFLYEKVIHAGLTLDELFETIKKLEIINIRLDDDDDPQLIFESLNSTGLDLSEADKIRNYLLMSLDSAEQEKLYTRYWNPIEIATRYDPSPFARDYLTMKKGKIERIDKIYFIFKAYAEDEKISREHLLEEMHHFAKIYGQIADASIGTERINRMLRQLGTLDSTAAYPFFMAFFDYVKEAQMTEDETYKVLNIIETYWARRIICTLPSSALNKIFATLHRDILSHINRAPANHVPKYTDVLTYILLKRTQTATFPSDEDVRGDFKTRQIYKMPANTRMFFLERFENQNSKERHDVVKELTEKNITIEHIMPQNLSAKWKKALGDDWQRIHEQYLHTMANLTLTGYNSKYSNLTFLEKRDMEKGFKDSAFRLNNQLKLCNQWTEAELKDRQKRLLDIFMQLWPMPQTTFIPQQREAESAALDEEDYNFTGKSLQAYSIEGTRFPVKTWKEMLIQVCEYMLRKKRTTIEWLCAKEQRGFAKAPGERRQKVANGVFVAVANSTVAKINTLHGMFDECNIPASELVFEFRTDGEEKDEG